MPTLYAARAVTIQGVQPGDGAVPHHIGSYSMNREKAEQILSCLRHNISVPLAAVDAAAWALSHVQDAQRYRLLRQRLPKGTFCGHLVRGPKTWDRAVDKELANGQD